MNSKPAWPRRSAYLACAALATLLGVGSRRYASELPAFVAAYAGDTLWALTAYLAISAGLPDWPLARRAAAALLLSLAVEVSQLYHAPWIDAIRRTTVGALLLGSGFLWSDLACYAAGVAMGAAVEGCTRRMNRPGRGEAG